LGGGTFYKNKSLTDEGFIKINDGLYECWYTFKDLNKFVSKIPQEEYEFIDSPDDIILDNLSQNEKKKIFDIIQILAGKKRSKRTKRKKRTKRIKRKKRT